MDGCESWDYNESWVLKNWCFWTVAVEKTLESSSDCKIQSILREISPEYSLEGLMLMQYFHNLMQRTNWKRPWCCKDWRQQKGTEDELIGWHHRLGGQEFEQALGVGYGQGGLVCCSPWGHKKLDITKQLNWSLTDWDKQKPSLWSQNFLPCYLYLLWSSSLPFYLIHIKYLSSQK